eukprot:PhF_6_TR5662/c1_g1_i1/m.8318
MLSRNYVNYSVETDRNKLLWPQHLPHPTHSKQHRPPSSPPKNPPVHQHHKVVPMYHQHQSHLVSTSQRHLQRTDPLPPMVPMVPPEHKQQQQPQTHPHLLQSFYPPKQLATHAAAVLNSSAHFATRRSVKTAINMMNKFTNVSVAQCMSPRLILHYQTRNSDNF